MPRRASQLLSLGDLGIWRLAAKTAYTACSLSVISADRELGMVVKANDLSLHDQDILSYKCPIAAGQVSSWPFGLCLCHPHL